MGEIERTWHLVFFLKTGSSIALANTSGQCSVMHTIFIVMGDLPNIISVRLPWVAEAAPRQRKRRSACMMVRTY